MAEGSASTVESVSEMIENKILGMVYTQKNKKTKKALSNQNQNRN